MRVIDAEITAVEHDHSHDHHDHHDHHGHHAYGHDDLAHSHVSPAEAAPRGGPVLVDIGGDVGALIVYLDDALEATELPIESLDDPSLEMHTGVWRRPIGDRSVVVAVYPALLEGRYCINAPGTPSRELTVRGGAVTELDLRRTSSGAPSATD